MPIYEYHCEPCDRTFETLVRSSSDVPHCPSCGNLDLAKQFSVPAAAKVGGASGSLPVCADVGPSPMGGCGAGGCRSGMCSFD